MIKRMVTGLAVSLLLSAGVFGGTSASARPISVPAATIATSGVESSQVVTPDSASCSFGCSQTVNQSGISMTAFRNWCAGGITSSSTTTRPTCSSDNVPQSFIILSGSGRTPDGQDWDGFQVDAGWCYKVFFSSYLYGPIQAWYNRSNLGNLYVKVGNDATAYVQAQRFGSCP